MKFEDFKNTPSYKFSNAVWTDHHLIKYILIASILSALAGVAVGYYIGVN